MADIDKQYLQTVDDKGFVPNESRDAFFRKLRMKNENRTCFECKARNPTWISITYGVYVCLECSGEHRRKGVHISYVRSVEMDKFTPQQCVQMAVGGNGKAWNYFKSHGMGKTSDAGRPVDYSSRITSRYKQDIDKLTKETCTQLGLGASVAPAAAPAAEAAKEEAVEAPTSPTPPPKANPAPVVEPQVLKAPAATAAPSVVIVRKAAPPAAAAPKPAAAPAPAASQPSAAVPKPSGFSGQKTKAIDFDFDFDELEAEMAKPKPVSAKAAGYSAAAAAVPTPASAGGGYSAPAAKPAPQAMNQSGTTADKFSNKKGISSADFFGLDDEESASQRMDREDRYNHFSGSAQISSDAFFKG